MTNPPPSPLSDLIAKAVVQRVAELPDRTSPDDWPAAMLVTADELSEIVRYELEAALSQQLPSLTEKERKDLLADFDALVAGLQRPGPKDQWSAHVAFIRNHLASPQLPSPPSGDVKPITTDGPCECRESQWLRSARVCLFHAEQQLAAQPLVDQTAQKTDR